MLGKISNKFKRRGLIPCLTCFLTLAEICGIRYAKVFFVSLGFDAFDVRSCGSVMPVCKQPVATLTLHAFERNLDKTGSN